VERVDEAGIVANDRVEHHIERELMQIGLAVCDMPKRAPLFGRSADAGTPLQSAAQNALSQRPSGLDAEVVDANSDSSIL
jgi:hypothetical protein